MFVKLIKVFVKPGRMAEYLASQRIWNEETERAPGYLGGACASPETGEDVVWLMFFWRSAAEYREWMATEHDRIAGKADSTAFYDKLEISLLQSVLEEDGSVLPGTSGSAPSDAGGIQLWSEIYRATAILRTALRLRLFTRIDQGERTLAIASDVAASPELFEKLCLSLSSMGLLSRSSGEWRNTPLAARTLVDGAPACQNHIVLHNSRPSYVDRWFRLGESLGLPPELPDGVADQANFLLGMAETAAGGQAKVLAESVDLAGRRMLLDIGGGPGHYAIALCLAAPGLQAVVLDLEPTRAFMEEASKKAGLSDRISFLAADYRVGAFPVADVILLSNVLRGETAEDIDSILRRTYEALPAGGQIVIQDLFTEAPPRPAHLRTGLFLLHTAGANLTLNGMALALVNAGFELDRVQRFPQWVTLNGLIVAHRADGRLVEPQPEPR